MSCVLSITSGRFKKCFFSFALGGHSTFFGLVNTFVHIVMYIYYMLAAMGPKYRRYIWWKKYLTNFQMIQFVLIFSHAFQVILVYYFRMVISVLVYQPVSINSQPSTNVIALWRPWW